ncbi:hypothetical protein AM500_10435 [Bacillus sp. FJAT-18017]|uniref:DUF1273 domain-containing protein n=1 Tax=Bacillus sp. FJAT-18017 TaxID=1705566 RepID=UPI0006AF23A7|nr:DUF1273 domain-containing protein [Bacillus sp. FJAT-18017]ALC92744.1 hypothetical protein AM500_10435 [Bacillus sp. FJAT-18017]
MVEREEVSGAIPTFKVITISGYKPFELGIFQPDHPAASYIKAAYKKEILPLVETGLEWVLISGQLGAELWAAEAVFELQEDFPDLKLAVITPFLEQEEKWNDKNKEWYESILLGADYVDSVTKKKYDSPNQFRLKNQFLIKKSDALILLYDSEKEGSPKFMYEMAQQVNGYPVRLITFYDLQQIVEEEQLKKYEY